MEWKKAKEEERKKLLVYLMRKEIYNLRENILDSGGKLSRREKRKEWEERPWRSGGKARRILERRCSEARKDEKRGKKS